MANIAVTNYCNLECPYCFANRYITEEEKQSLTMEQLERILEFLGRNKTGLVGLIGGEPTLHPNFENIIKRCKEYVRPINGKVLIFTNGIKLSKFIPLMDNNVAALINANHPDIVGHDRYKEIEESLEMATRYNVARNISIGINLYPNMLDYNYIFDLADLYGTNILRVSYVAPCLDFANVDKEEYYKNAKEQFMKFANDCIDRGTYIKLDCNHVPECYFTDEELAYLKEYVLEWKSFCTPVIDITPDFRATACFGAYELVDIDGFDDIDHLTRYLAIKNIYPKATKNCAGKCKDCDKFNNLACQGGCLAFTNNKEES